MIRLKRSHVRRYAAIILGCFAMLDKNYVSSASAQQASSKSLGLYLQKNASNMGDIEAIRTFIMPSQTYFSPVIAILSLTSKKHRSVRIVKTIGHRVVPIWQDDNLLDTIRVADVSDFKVEDIGDVSYLTFNGCLPHVCGFPGDYGFFLYSFSTNKAYFADISESTSDEVCMTSSQELKNANPDVRKAMLEYINRAVVRGDTFVNIPECPVFSK